MASITSLAPELLTLIFKAVQSSSSGPRYALTPSEPPEDTEESHARWILIDAGPLHLAATCKKLREVYLSRYVTSNLVLEIPAPPDNEVLQYERREPFYHFWQQREKNGNLLQQLKNMKAAAKRKPLTRFMLDSKWWAWPYNIREICMEMWSEILRDVSEVFGDELMVVICSQGERVFEDFRQYAPKQVRELEDMSRNLRARPEEDSSMELEISTPEPSTSTRSLRNGREIVPPTQFELPSKEDLAAAAPLALHVYCGYRKHGADIYMGHALSAFASKNLQSFYFSSDPNNFRLVGDSRRPQQGQDLYKIKNFCSIGNPWRHFLPSWSIAAETLESIILDCSFFWSELAFALPHFRKLKKLDCELVLLHTEPIYPYDLESKESAGRRILQTCQLKDDIAQKERGLKKNRGKQWLAIGREGIVLPRIEPEVKTMSQDPHSRFATVDMKVCMQVARRRIAKSRRG